MFTVIYSFEIKELKTNQFELAWHELTQLIYKHENSLGSRLHKSSDLQYIAYACWPDKATWENSGKNMPEEADIHRSEMREACSEIKTIFQLNLVDDLLKDKSFDSET